MYKWGKRGFTFKLSAANMSKVVGHMLSRSDLVETSAWFGSIKKTVRPGHESSKLQVRKTRTTNEHLSTRPRGILSGEVLMGYTAPEWYSAK